MANRHLLTLLCVLLSWNSGVHALANRVTHAAMRAEHAKQKKPYRPLHHPPRLRNPVAVEHDLEQRFVLGSDESGTGALAGPIVTVTCCLVGVDEPKPSWLIPGVQDAKRLSKADQRRICQAIQDDPDHYKWTYAVRTAEQVDAAPSLAHVVRECFHESVETMVDEVLLVMEPELDADNVLSIVDGKTSPKDMIVPSRPFVNGDNVVYTIALASILAKLTRETLMAEEAQLYPSYGFEKHQGYGTPAHLEALGTHGLSPIHRRSCKALSRYKDATALQREQDVDCVDRASFLSWLLGGGVLSLGAAPARAMYTDPKTGIRLPDTGEIEAAVPQDWTQVDNPLLDDDNTQMSRLDSSNDALFYKDPRFVEHVDDTAVQIMTKYIGNALQQAAANKEGSLSVLDLCSSWTSHIPPDISVPLKRVAGLGMNAEELQANPSLTEWVVRDLNQSPQLPYEDTSFDVVLCQLSIDYLTRPLAVCREVARVLRPGGTVHIFFSNRLFLSKAVALWTGADDVDHAFTVASYLHVCDQPSPFADICARDLSTRNTRSGRIVGDPMYVVTGVKR